MLLASLWTGGLLLTIASWKLSLIARRGERRTLRMAAGIWLLIAGPCAFALLAGGAYRTWFLLRPQPAPVERELFQGITYQREVQRTPWPMITHIVRIDLRAPGLRFLATPSDRSGGREFRAMTTSEFLTTHGLQLAINGGFFHPFHSNAPWDFYPRSGESVDVLGLGMSEGERTSGSARGYRSLLIPSDNRALIADRVTTGSNVVSGLPLSLREREADEESPVAPDRQPRTAVALDATSATLLLFVIDGRQPNYSEGASLNELADLIRRHGGVSAINLDGGGSSTLVIEGADGKAEVLNTPIHTHIPGRERPVATHLGIYAEKEKEKEKEKE